jgi:hypothetical protein
LRDMLSPSLLTSCCCRLDVPLFVFSYWQLRDRRLGWRVGEYLFRNQNRIKHVCRETTRATF